MPERPTELTVRLQAAPEYVIGLPFFIEVTLANETEGAEYYDLIPCDPLSPPFPVELTFTAGATSVTLPARSSMRGEARKGFDLVPGESRTFVLDVSELEPTLEPGPWQCQARWVMRHERPLSAPITLALVAPDPADLPLLARLRMAGGSQTPSWANLIKSPTQPEEEEIMERLSERTSRALVPYLILHQALQGSESLSAFPPEVLAPHQQGPWASEAGVLAYELLWARQAPDLAQRRTALLQRWPGLAFRVEAIETGAGLLTTLRRQYGRAERSP
jgi:hypothetical protein